MNSATTLLKELVKELRSQLRAAWSVYRLRAHSLTARQLEIGSGPVRKSGWLTLDMCLGADVYWDLRRPLPFAEATFDIVYCSHVLEHFSYPELSKLLREVNRVLRPDGRFLVSVPDASLYVDAYLGKGEPKDLLRYPPAVISTRPMDLLNYIFYMDAQHRFMFDAENLAHHCRQAGFVSCEKRAFDPALDLEARDYESLYMLCRKASAS